MEDMVVAVDIQELVKRSSFDRTVISDPDANI
jgi:hypothetical protein